MAEALKPLLDIVYEGRFISVNRPARLPGQATDRFEVVTKDTCAVIAEIRWYTPWRTYALYPRAETVFEATCLTDLARCLTYLVKERRSTHHDNADAGAGAQQGYPRVARRFFDEEDT